jgi:hypothetical protein
MLGRIVDTIKLKDGGSKLKQKRRKMKELRERLLSQVVKVPGPLETDCWLCDGRVTHKTISWLGETHSASRLSYLAFVGPVKFNHYVLHRCDIGGCINPNHLFQGTPQDNVLDAIAKGRFRLNRAGEGSTRAKLTEVKVKRIKAMILAGVPLKNIAIEFGVSPPCISDIKTGNSWGWVEPMKPEDRKLRRRV